MWTSALGMLTGQANIDPYHREDSWDQATRILKVTSLRSATRCCFLEKKEQVLQEYYLSSGKQNIAVNPRILMDVDTYELGA